MLNGNKKYSNVVIDTVEPRLSDLIRARGGGGGGGGGQPRWNDRNVG